MLSIIQGKLEVASLINDQKVCGMPGNGYRHTKGHFFFWIGSFGFVLASVTLVVCTVHLCMWPENITNLYSWIYVASHKVASIYATSRGCWMHCRKHNDNIQRVPTWVPTFSPTETRISPRISQHGIDTSNHMHIHRFVDKLGHSYVLRHPQLSMVDCLNWTNIIPRT